MLNGEAQSTTQQKPEWGQNEIVDWNDIERNWLKHIAISRAKEDCELRQDYEEEAAELAAELQEAVDRHTRLTEALLQARVLFDERQADLESLHDQFDRKRRYIAEQRSADDIRVSTWIENGRAAHGDKSRDHDDSVLPHSESLDGPLRPERSERVTRHKEAASPIETRPENIIALGRQITSPRSANLKLFAKDWKLVSTPSRPSSPSHGATGYKDITIVNPSGNVLGTLKRLEGDTPWIKKLIQNPILRNVEVRTGRTVTQDQLDVIHDINEPKKSKWLSFMIQATGDQQEHACHTCSKGQGLYSLCIIIGGSDFPRCGNCEWNKQACIGTAAHSSGSSKHVRQSSSVGQYEKLRNHDRSPSAASTPSRALSHKDRSVDDSMDRESCALTERCRRPRGKDKPGRTLFRPNAPTKEHAYLLHTLDEITQDNLELRDDGMIYLEPEIMRGVPLRKINEEHAYWEADWKSVEPPVRAKYEEWVERLSALKQMPEHMQTERDRTSVFQAGRQVNRGINSLKFLQTGDFHPFQVIGKQWITPSLVHYDTLFRMVATLDELGKFTISVTPLQWLRQRLHELYSANPQTFKLDRTMAKMYHDPKLALLRTRNGFGNIGRPSIGTKLSGEKRKDGHAAASSVASTPVKRARAESNSIKAKQSKNQLKQRRHSQLQQKQLKARSSSPIPETPNKDLHVHQAQMQGKFMLTSDRDPLLSFSEQISSLHDDDLQYSGYTSTDSLTQDPVVKKDWRVHQVKTAHLTTNPGTTQYWHWVDETQVNALDGSNDLEICDPMFEHQVLKEMKPATSWGIFKEPVDFHLRLRELTVIKYARDCQKIVIDTQQVEGVDHRGSILAQFKRERTKRRFLSFMRKKAVRLVRVPGELIEDAWNLTKSDIMPGGESD